MVYKSSLCIWNCGVYNPLLYIETVVYTTPLSILKLWCINPPYVNENYGVYNPFMYIETVVYATPLSIWKLLCINPLYFNGNYGL